jgi:hypothetical protein
MASKQAPARKSAASGAAAKRTAGRQRAIQREADAANTRKTAKKAAALPGAD